MKKIISIITVCLLTLSFNPANGQILGKREEGASIFNTGKPLTTSAVNFENMFANFPLHVTNAYIVNLLSYEYLGKIKSPKHARKYLDKNINSDTPRWNFIVSKKSSNDTTSVNRYTTTLSPTKNNESKELLQQIIEELSTTFVKEGYEVYNVKFRYEQKEHDYFIFVNPDTKQVVLEANIFGFYI